MLSITNAILLMTALFNASIAVIIIRGNWKSATNIFLSVYLIALSIWALGLIGTQIGTSYEQWLYSTKITYLMGIIIAGSFYLFSISFPEGKSPLYRIIIAIYGLCAVYAFAVLLYPEYLTEQIISHEWGNSAQLNPLAWAVFTVTFCFLYIGGLIRIWLKYLKSNGDIRKRLAVIGIGATITGVAGLYYDILLASPYINEFRYIWTGPLFNTVMVILILYAVFKLNLFNTKVILVELLIAALWIFTLLRTLLATDSIEQIWNGGLFIISLAIGFILIKSVKQEVAHREKVEHLAKDLEKANARLKELDKMKSEFVSIASHQLRSPLTAIRGYASMFLEGSYGALTEKGMEAIKRIQESSRYMALSVEDYLNVSRIEAGNMKYELSDFNLHTETEKVVEEAQSVAEHRKLTLVFTSKCDGTCMVHGDIGKTRQVLHNLIDNAMKYTKHGTITVTTYDNTGDARAGVEVNDTGIGMSPETLKGMFQKFTRAKNANSVNVTGTGLGLFIAKRMIDDMGGALWAQSEGEGKGSSFFIELPMPKV